VYSVPLNFKSKAVIQPIPADSLRAARQARVFEKRLQALGSLDALKAQALDVINQASEEDEPAEITRMRLLFRQVYTQAELGEYVAASFATLGFTE